MEEQPEAGFSCRRAERISSLGRHEHFEACRLFTGDDIPLVRCLCHRNKLKDVGMDGKDSGNVTEGAFLAESSENNSSSFS